MQPPEQPQAHADEWHLSSSDHSIAALAARLTKRPRALPPNAGACHNSCLLLPLVPARAAAA
eukprot:99108-Alexandrium_andersonii.AAC.1